MSKTMSLLSVSLVLLLLGETTQYSGGTGTALIKVGPGITAKKGGQSWPKVLTPPELRAQKPSAEIKNWPGEYQAAAVFSVDTEEDFANALKATEILRQKGVQGSFYMVSDLAEGQKEVVARVKSMGEVAIHGDSHTGFANQSYQQQLDRLRRAKTVLSTLSGTEVVGFRAPELSMDLNTMRAVSALKLLYVGTSPLWGSSPSVVEYPGGETGELPKHKFVFLPQILEDDFNLFYLKGLSPSKALELWKALLDQALARGGLFFFSSHTTPPWGVFHDKERLMGELIELSIRKKFWVTTGAELAKWILAKHELRAKTSAVDQNRITLTVTNPGPVLLEPVGVYVNLPDSFEPVELKASASSPGFKYKYYPEEKRLLTIFKSLPPGELQLVIVTGGRGSVNKEREPSSS